MIIDELFYCLKYNDFIDMEYIQEEAEFFDYPDILKAIKERDQKELKKAFQNYVLQNNYNKNIIEALNDLRIKFD